MQERSYELAHLSPRSFVAVKICAIGLAYKRCWNSPVEVEYILIVIASEFTSVKLNGRKKDG